MTRKFIRKILVIMLLLSGVIVSQAHAKAEEFTSGQQKIIHRVSLEKLAREKMKQGLFLEAIDLYKQATLPQNLNQPYEGSTARGGLREIYKIIFEYEKALNIIDGVIRRNFGSEVAMFERDEILALIEYQKTGDPKKIIEHISNIRTVNQKKLPPIAYWGSGSTTPIVDVIKLYDVIGDYDAGIKFIDEILEYFRSGKAGDPKPGRVDAEYLKIREAFLQDKVEGKKGSMKEGKPGRATLALIKSDYFPW